jgi:predicted flavoprotein YhiN
VVVTGVEPVRDRTEWRVNQQGGPPFMADAVIVATGGLSVPATGSDGLGLSFAKALGHTINQTYAALTPLIARLKPDTTTSRVRLTASAEATAVRQSFERRRKAETTRVRLKADTTGAGAAFTGLAGVSVPVTLTARAGPLASTASGGFLFTHNGYSGPAVLDVSHVAVRSRSEMDAPAEILVRWTALDDESWEAALRPVGTRTILSVVASHMPARLAEALVEISGVDQRRKLSQLTRSERSRLVATLVRGDLPWIGDEGYKKAEVTGGGLSLAEVDARTLESKRHKGLFFCGEILDAFGPIGGYNFLWAWATGRAAGIHAAAR